MRSEQERINELLARPYTGETHARLRLEMATTMDKNVGVYRDEAGLREALAKVQELKRRYKRSRSATRAASSIKRSRSSLELGFMLDCAETIMRSAIIRKESRGAQSRTDYPGAQRRGVAQAHPLDTIAEAEEPEISYVPVTITKWKPEARSY